MVSEIARRLQQGCSVTVFPEGGITDETQIRAFKSSVFEAAVISRATVVPVLIRYDDGNKPSVARWASTTFFTHIIRLMKNRRLDVTLTILSSIREESDRRVIAERCRHLINEANEKSDS